MRKRREDTKRPRMGARQKLEVRNKDPNYEYRWFNDEGGRIEEAVRSGREHVLKDDVVLDPSMERPPLGSCVNEIVGKHPNGTPLVAYLMRIPKELYDEDQIEKSKAADLIDQSIRSGSSQVPNAYTPGQASASVVGPVTKIERGR